MALFHLLLVFHLLAFAGLAVVGEICYTRLFSFGDSITDNGNYIMYNPTPGPGGIPPYGETYFHHPTGRFSDGRLIIDFIAEALKTPYITPYLAGKTAQDFQYGANFAVSGATALGREFLEEGLKVFMPYTLEVQMSWFRKVLQLLGSSDHKQQEIMASSLFLVGEIGWNDYNQPLFQNRTLDEVKTYVPSVIEIISSSVSDLINLGAKTVVVPGILPTGCVPGFLTFFQTNNRSDYDPKSGCIERFNELAQYHNRALNEKLAQLHGIHPEVSIVFADYYKAIMRIVMSPLQYGFGDTQLVACCGGGGPYNMNFTVTCGGEGSTVCADPSKFVSWDGLHLTEAAYGVIADDLLGGPYTSPPILSTCKH